MNRPKIKLEKTIIDKSMEILTFLLIIGSGILIGIYYNQLPEKLPIHFNWPSKDKNGFGTKDLLWASPIICGIIGIGIYKLNQYPWIFNYPAEIDENNAEYNYRQATQMLRILNLIIGFLCLSVTLMSVLDGLGIENELDKFLGPLFPILLIGLDNVIIATTPEFDQLVTDLKTFKFEEPPTVKVIESTQVVTIEKVKSLFTHS